MNGDHEINDPKWEENMCQVLQEYNNKYHLFKDPDDFKKVRYVIEDTHNIRFFEFADDMIQKDVFNDDITPEVLPKKRGRPRKYPISDDPPKPKMKRGRPKLIDVDANEKKKLRNKLCVQYHVDRYKMMKSSKRKLKEKAEKTIKKLKKQLNNNVVKDMQKLKLTQHLKIQILMIMMILKTM